MARRGLAAWLVRRRGRVVLLWTLAAALLVPRGARIEERLVGSEELEDAESTRVSELLDTAFESPLARTAVLVVGGLPMERSGARAALADLLRAVDTLPEVRATLSPLAAADTLLVGTGGRGAVIVAGLAPAAHPDSLVRALREATRAPGARLAATFPEATLAWTGDVPLNAGLRRFSAEDVRRSELRALPLTLALLLVGFGAVVAALLPVLSGVLAIAVSLGIAGLISAHWTLSITLQNIVTILGLALGIDYGLLMVRRFREARGAGLDAVAAATEAAARGGHTLLLSGAAVAAGFLALAAVPLNELRSVAAGGLVVVAVSVLLATTLLPALLAWLGDRIDAGRLPLPAPRRRDAAWHRWARAVVRRPWITLAVAGTPLLLLALPALRLRTAVPTPAALPQEVEAVRGLRELGEMGRLGATLALRVVLEVPAGDVLAPEGRRAIGRVVRHLEADPRIGRVRSLPVAYPAAAPAFLVRASLPDSVRRGIVDRSGRRALIEALPAAGVGGPELTELVRDLRGVDWPAVTGAAGARVSVGGLPAFSADYEERIRSRFGTVAALVLGGTFLALMLGFRSVLVPLKAVALNLLSVGASFGALVLVFQDGHGAALLGVTALPDGVLPVIPVLVFCTVFGISMDYEVFLVSRVAEARRAGLSEEEAIAEGVSRTAGLITSAAAIMVVVFGAFALGDFVSTQMLGFTLAVAVLLDATVVRLALGPALLRLAGRWNWWPGDR